MRFFHVNMEMIRMFEDLETQEVQTCTMKKTFFRFCTISLSEIRFKEIYGINYVFLYYKRPDLPSTEAYAQLTLR